MTTSNRLAVFVGPKRVGSVANESGEYIFTYENVDQLDPLRDLVSLTMPVRLKSYETQILMPPLQTNLPEGALLENLRKRFGKIIDTYDDLNLLQLVGQNMIGRLRYGVDTHDTVEPDLKASDLRAILENVATQKLFDELLDRFGPSSGVSGVQPKFLWGDSGNKVAITTGQYIVKSASPEYFGLAVNEYFCLQAARAAGLVVPDAMLSKSGEVLVVNRFDRDEGQHALAFEEFCALLHLPNHGKYMASYEQIAEAIARIPCRPQAMAMKRFYLAVAFSMLIQNGDAHLKNFAVLYEQADQVAFAPVYDLVTTTVYLKNDIPALSLMGSKQWPVRDALADFGVIVCGLKRKQVNILLNEACAAIRQTLPTLIEYGDANPRYADLTQQMAAIWQQGLLRYSA